MGLAADYERTRTDAAPWAARLLVILGATGGGFLGLLYAPDIQSDLHLFGVDQYTLGPGVVIVTSAICLGALLARRATR